MPRTYTRQTFMRQVASGFAVLAVGCGGDDTDETGTETDATTDPTAASGTQGTTSGTSAGSTSSAGSSETTDTPEPTTGDPGTSSGGADTGSSTGGGDSSGSTTGGEINLCPDEVLVAAISLNHGHVLEIPFADIIAGVEVSYDATGASGHCHEVVMTADDFATLRAGGTVVKYSCNGGDHEYVLSCVDGAKRPGDPAAECMDDPQFGAC